MRRFAWLFVLVAAGPLSAQEVIELRGGESIRVQAIEPETVYVEIEVPVEVPVFECPEGWTCEPPAAPSSPYMVVVSREAGATEENRELMAGPGYISLVRRDGSWNSTAHGAAIAGVDSVVFYYNGARTRERLYRYEVTGGELQLVAGVHELMWQVFGSEPDSASTTITIRPPNNSGNVQWRVPSPMRTTDGVAVQLTFPLTDIRDVADFDPRLNGVRPTGVIPDGLGWYWRGAPDDGTISVVQPDGSTWRATYVKVEPDG